MGFESLDFVYHPSRDVKRDLAYFTDVLADHVEGDAPILVYRVNNLREALASLPQRGWQREATFEIPHDPICSFRAPGGQRIAVYELTRPGAAATFEGRRDF